MISIRRFTPFLCLLALLSGVGRAQTPAPTQPGTAQPQDAALAKEEQELVKHCVGVLTTFAGVAKSQKVGQRAKQAYDLVLQYDPNQSGARSELGFKKEKDQWVPLPAEKRKKWLDKASYEGRFKVMDEWAKTAVKLGDLHRKLGLKLKEAGNLERATHHLEKAVFYNAMDKEANIALGYKEGPGFFGTDAQIEYAKKMKEIETKAVEIARKDYAVTQLAADAMPIELQNLRDQCPDWMKKPSFDISGAKSENFTVWVRGSQEHADTAVKWAERGLEFGLYLIGDKAAKRLQFKERATRTWSWQGYLATTREREEFLKANANTHEGQTLEQAQRFANTAWRAKEGPAVVKVGPSPRYIQDSLIAYVMMDGLVSQRNDGFGQGIIHAVTWYMKATSISRWGALPEGSVAEDALELPEGTNWWMRTVRDQAMSHQDWPWVQIPREKLSNFRNDCRLKAWSMTTWLMAAYPDKWLEYFLLLPEVDKKMPQLEELEAIVQKVFGKPSEVINEEWREWARGDSGVAYGTGYGPPLSPERPSTIELAALDQINLIRAQQVGYTWTDKITEGTWVALAECEMDAETSTGCDLHAKYVTNHPELVQDPSLGIHEENPAHEDFTRRGQQAGQGNIVTSTGRVGDSFARESVDGWMSAPYHRFPMLEHNVKRLGYAHVDSGTLSVSVLDMGSLEEPYDPKKAPRLVVWPAPNMTNVPISFGNPEWPNPLADQPEDHQDVTKCGYAISLQMQDEIARSLATASIEVFESRKGGKTPAKNFVAKNDADYKLWTERCRDQVECYVHTPSVPLNKKRDERNALFAIPKKPLEANKAYQVRCMLHIGTADPHVFFWEFTTGTQREGLKLKN